MSEIHGDEPPAETRKRADSGGAGPALRGYRRQFIYVLWRILTAEKDLVFQPEHLEDLAVYRDGRLVELIQVKAHQQPLNLSHFKPRGQMSFFARCASNREIHREARLTIASFGDVGQELSSAIDAEEPSRTAVAEKICQAGQLTVTQALDVLGALQIHSVEEESLTQEIYSALGKMVTALDVKEALGNLMHWMHRCSEQSRRITKHDLAERVGAIGAFVGDIASHHLEWLSTIHPVGLRSMGQRRDAKELAAEFHAGVGARFEHIEADLDVLRPSRLTELDEAFSSCNVVFLHGASGQGKSTLAYRYLKNSCPGVGRFQITCVDGTPHALRIARAFAAQVRTLGFPVTVYLDVTPHFIGWVDLVKELSFYPDIHVLVTLREEDWRRAAVSGASFRWRDSELRFDRQEAQELFACMTHDAPAPHFVSFEDAWARFGEAGPLLEFVYMVSQGGMLRERLDEQIATIESEVRAGRRSSAELDLLRLVSVASALGGRATASHVLKALGFPLSGDPLRLLEREYLLRTTEDGQHIEGLHPIRSQLLAERLCDPALSSWQDTITEVLPFVATAVLDSFLLNAFSRESLDRERLVDALRRFPTPHWQAVRAVVRGLLWLGVRQYVDANAILIEEIEKDLGLSWMTVLDFDIAGGVPDMPPLFKTILPEDKWGPMEKLRSRQTSKRDVFAPMLDWLGTRTSPPAKPSSAAEWHSLAEVGHWNARTGHTLPIRDWVQSDELTDQISDLPLNVLADVVLAFHETFGDDEVFLKWSRHAQPALLDRLREETLTPKIEEDGKGEIKAHFVVRLDLFPDPQSQDFAEKLEKRSLGAEAMNRVHLLRRLVPDRRGYACQGRGHNVLNVELPVDETTKNILRENLPIHWDVALNAVFRGIAELRFRPTTWEEYAARILAMREVVCGLWTSLASAIEVCLEKGAPPLTDDSDFSLRQWKQLSHQVDLPHLPVCAVGDLGLTSESNAASPRDVPDSGTLSIDPYRPWLHAAHEFRRTVTNFAEQAQQALLLIPALGNAHGKRQKEEVLKRAKTLGVEQNVVRLSRINLSDAYKVMPSFQAESRRLMGGHVDTSRLKSLEMQETDLFAALWALWFDFLENPGIRIKSPRLTCKKKEERLRSTFLTNCERALRKSGEDRNLAPSLRAQRRGQLVVISDAPTSQECLCSLEFILSALRKASKRTGNQARLEFMLAREFGEVLVLPCVKGRPLLPAAWHLSHHDLTAAKPLQWFQQSLVPVGHAVLSSSGLSCWDIPRIEVGQRFHTAFMKFFESAAHLSDILRIGEVDEKGRKILKDYVGEVQASRGDEFQRALDAATEILDDFNAMSEAEAQERESLMMAAIELQQWYEVSRQPRESVNGQLEVALEEIAEWTPRLRQATGHVIGAFCHWTDDALRETPAAI
jgi:hypothetical protein